MTASEDTTSTQYQSVILPRKDFFELVVGEIPDPVFAAFHRHIGKRLLHFGHGIDLFFEGLGGNEAADIHRLLLPDAERTIRRLIFHRRISMQAFPTVPFLLRIDGLSSPKKV